MEITALELEQAYRQNHEEREHARQHADRADNTIRRAEQQIVESNNRLAEYEARMANKGNAAVQRYFSGLLEQGQSSFREEQSAEALRMRRYDFERETQIQSLRQERDRL